MRVRLLVPVVLAVALLGAGCSGDGDDDTAPTQAPDPSSTAAAPVEPCELTATVDGIGYHARGIYGEYDVDTTVSFTAPLSPCAGVDGDPVTFNGVVGVRKAWALVATVDGEEVFFVTDELPPIPLGSEFAQILIGDEGDLPSPG